MFQAISPGSADRCAFVLSELPGSRHS